MEKTRKAGPCHTAAVAKADMTKEDHLRKQNKCNGLKIGQVQIFLPNSFLLKSSCTEHQFRYETRHSREKRVFFVFRLPPNCLPRALGGAGDSVYLTPFPINLAPPFFFSSNGFHRGGQRYVYSKKNQLNAFKISNSKLPILTPLLYFVAFPTFCQIRMEFSEMEVDYLYYIFCVFHYDQGYTFSSKIIFTPNWQYLSLQTIAQFLLLPLVLKA